MTSTGGDPGTRTPATEWTFLTNHAYALILVAAHPDLRVREIADHIGITVRATQKVLAELVEAGYLERHREGRRNNYTINSGEPLRHPLAKNQEVGRLIEVLGPRLKSGLREDRDS